MPRTRFTGGGGGAGANTALSNLASVLINQSLTFDADSTYDIGDSSNFVANAYIDKIYLDNSIYLDTDNYALLIKKTGNTPHIQIWPYSNQALMRWAYSSTVYGQISCLSNELRWTGANINQFSFNINIEPLNDSSIKIGSSTKYFLEGYFDKLYLNSTATLDGATAGHLLFTGDLVPATDDTEWIGEIGTPFKAIKGLVIKDTTDGKHYKVEVVSGNLTATALD